MLQEIIKINYEGEKALVSARELHEFLGLQKRFSAWLDQYIKEDNKYGFEKDIDFTNSTYAVMLNNGAKRMLQDCYLTISTALVICRMSKYNPKAIKIIKCLQKIKGISVEVLEQKRLEYQFGKMLDDVTGFNWDKQYSIDGGKYKLDFYLKDVLIVEYDEKHHTYQQKEDEERITYCRDWLSKNEGDGDNWKCPVIRVKEGNELQGLNRIVRHIAGFELFDTQYDYKLQVCDIGNR